MRCWKTSLLPIATTSGWLASLAFGEDRQSHLSPAVHCVHTSSVRLKLHIPAGTLERMVGLSVVTLPVSHGTAVIVTNGADGVVADRQTTELFEVGTGSVERPTGSSQAQQTLGGGTDETLDSEPSVERVV